ncbi:MAG: PadR family transcriptional regulator, regulatory protein PadR [Clostridiales bacterium]|nr:PadR family transcriptional regulator, regulatory protein PadR [Clostridiales bacterium]
MDKEMMKGSTDILLLSQLVKEDQYGYQIIKALENMSNQVYKMGEGTLYPALKRLEQKGYLISYWGEAELGGRRKYYQLTKDGERYLKKKLQEWKQVNQWVCSCEEGLVWNK